MPGNDTLTWPAVIPRRVPSAASMRVVKCTSIQICLPASLAVAVIHSALSVGDVDVDMPGLRRLILSG